MSLDKNLFTLVLTPNKEDPNVVDLVDPNGTIHYRKQRVDNAAGGAYTIQVYDFMSESLLITATAPSSTSKTKVLELYNPTTTVELKYTGTLSFRWSFKWEEHEFEWKREECYLIRKPDPPVLVAITKEPAGRLKTVSTQILDYNLNRFDIDDRKGLEIVILTALLTFQDANDTYHNSSTSDGTTSRKNSSPVVLTPNPSYLTLTTPTSPPPLPSKPAPRMGADRIAEMQAMRGEVNEVNVEEEGSVNDYADYVGNLLEDDAMLFVTVRSDSANFVPKVLQVVEETKRRRHKAGLDENELHQYVLYDTIKPKGPKRINLDDDKGKNKYVPPNSLIVHLSKIPMPELQPKTHKSSSSLSLPSPTTEKPEKPKDGKKAVVSSSSPPRRGLLRRSKSKSRSPSPKRESHRVHAHQVHPHQPSPSPSQLNNPGIYVAPPPPPSPRPPSYAPPGPSLYGPYTPAVQPSSRSVSPGGQSPISSAQNVVSGIFDMLHPHRR